MFHFERSNEWWPQLFQLPIQQLRDCLVHATRQTVLPKLFQKRLNHLALSISALRNHGGLNRINVLPPHHHLPMHFDDILSLMSIWNAIVNAHEETPTYINQDRSCETEIKVTTSIRNKNKHCTHITSFRTYDLKFESIRSNLPGWLLPLLLLFKLPDDSLAAPVPQQLHRQIHTENYHTLKIEYPVDRFKCMCTLH